MLYLNNNQITSIESGDFAGLSSLTNILLDGNQIKSITT
jgi:Leucine-rich repeat (LRR) protein